MWGRGKGASGHCGTFVKMASLLLTDTGLYLYYQVSKCLYPCVCYQNHPVRCRRVCALSASDGQTSHLGGWLLQPHGLFCEEPSAAFQGAICTDGTDAGDPVGVRADREKVACSFALV